ncbi:mitochondrial distribution and morphology [Dispira parvispora]|uniref:Mitochondrial distribution and morphology n=1 Tax=Dispira parvispora TaxID=1520584 RepID=A0A9W8AV61_9FUNG|nr:mitochondrial distribution and morphology [Dispira parvispora]
MYSEEWKLRPIYDALSTCSYKRALSLCNAQLKKDPKYTLVKTLKAQALARLEHFSEAEQLAQEVRATQPTDVIVLNNLAFLYRNLDQSEQAVAVYEEVIPHAPKIRLEPICIQWFINSVRTGQLATQHKAALKLNQVFKKKKYVMWTILSLLTQARDPTTPSNQRQLKLTLAERMLQKAEGNRDMDTVEGLRVYLRLLDQHGKYTDALAVLDQPTWSPFLDKDPDLFDTYVSLLLRAKRYETALTVVRTKIEAQCDDWQHYVAYIEALGGLVQGQGAVCDNPGDKDWAEAITFLDNLVEARGEGRTVLLARLAWAHLCHVQKLVVHPCPDVIPRLTAYIDAYGGRFCAFEDVQSYLLGLSTELLGTYRTQLEADLAQLESAPASDALPRYLNLMKLYLCTLPPGASQVSATLQDVVRRLVQYVEKVTSMAKGDEHAKLPKDSNGLVLLAAQCLTDLFNLHSSSPQRWGYLTTALALLEWGLHHASDYFPFKLLAIRLYGLIGVYERSHALYDSLDVKNVQHDTISYWLVGQGRTLGCFDQDLRHACSALRFYDSNEVETPDMLVLAYKNGTYSQIGDFLEFQRRVTYSLQHHIILTSAFRNEFITETNLDQLYKTVVEVALENFPYDSEVVDSWVDNRDFTVMPYPRDRESDTLEQRTRPTTAGSYTECRLAGLLIHTLHQITVHNVDGLDEAKMQLAQVVKEAAATPEVAADTRALASMIETMANVASLTFREFSPNGVATSDTTLHQDTWVSLVAPLESQIQTLQKYWDARGNVPQSESPVPPLHQASLAAEMTNFLLLFLKALTTFRCTPTLTTTYHNSLTALTAQIRDTANSLLQWCQTYAAHYATQDNPLHALAGQVQQDTIFTSPGKLALTKAGWDVKANQYVVSSWKLSFDNLVATVESRITMLNELNK